MEPPANPFSFDVAKSSAQRSACAERVIKFRKKKVETDPDYKIEENARIETFIKYVFKTCLQHRKKYREVCERAN